MIQRLAREDMFLKTAQLFRIVILLWVALHSLLLLPFHATIFGPEAYVLRTRFDGSLWSWFFHLAQHPAVNPHYLWFFVVQLSAIACSILGIWPRLMMVLVYLSTMNIYNLSGVVLDGGNNLSQLLLFYLMLINTSGKPYPDTLWGIVLRSISNAAFMMCRLQIAIVYLTAGLLKLNGHLWQNGMALYYLFQSETYGHPWLGALVREFPMVSLAGTYATLLFQYLFPMFIWMRRWRLPLMLMGTCLHLGIAFGMGLFTFGLVMCVSYLAFFTEEWAAKFLQYFPTRDPLVIAFDEHCRVCQRIAGLVRRLDWQKLIIIDQAHAPDDKRLQALNLDQRIQRIQAFDCTRHYQGFAAMAELFRRVPLLMLLLPPVQLMKIRGWGERIYERLTAQSWRRECQSGACTLS